MTPGDYYYVYSILILYWYINTAVINYYVILDEATGTELL